MATDLERLVVSLEANIKKYEREMARARGVTEKSLRDVETSVSASTARVESSIGRMGASIRTGLASALAGLSIGSLTKFADANTRIENSLKVSGLAGEDLSKTYETLFQAAQRQGIPFEALATLYGRAALAQKELGVSSAELTRFTEGVAVALRVAGQSSEQASGALLQLGQLLASGKVQAEEFNSVQEGALPVLQAVAAGLKEAGGSVAKLKELVKDGEVSSQAFFRAFEAGRPILDGMAANSAPKLSDGITRIENALTKLIGEMDKLSGTSKAVASAIDTMVKSFEVPDVFRNTLHELELLVKGYQAIANAVRQAAGVIAVIKGQPLPQEEGDPPPLTFRVRPKAEPGTASPAISAPGQVSTKQYPVTKKDKKDAGGGGGTDKLNEYEREIAAIEKRTRAFDSERESVGKSALEVARAEGAFRLMEAAKKANVPVTDELRTKVDGLAGAYAKAKVALDEAEERQRNFENASRQVGSTLADGFKDAVLEGEKLNVIMERLLKSLASRGIDSLFDSLFGKTGAGTGLLSSLFSSIGGGLAPGRAAGGPVVAGRPYTVGESGRETFVPTSPGRIVSNRNSRGGGLQVTVVNAPSQPSVSETSGPRGRRLDIEFEDMVGGMIAGGRFDKQLSSRFGMRATGR